MSTERCPTCGSQMSFGQPINDPSGLYRWFCPNGHAERKFEMRDNTVWECIAEVKHGLQWKPLFSVPEIEQQLAAAQQEIERLRNSLQEAQRFLEKSRIHSNPRIISNLQDYALHAIEAALEQKK